jgi:hypothetical protein
VVRKRCLHTHIDFCVEETVVATNWRNWRRRGKGGWLGQVCAAHSAEVNVQLRAAPPMQMPPLLPAAKLLIPWIVEFDFLGRLAKKPTSPPHNEWRRRDNYKRGLVTRISGFMIRVGVPGGGAHWKPVQPPARHCGLDAHASKRSVHCGVRVSRLETGPPPGRASALG